MKAFIPSMIVAALLAPPCVAAQDPAEKSQVEPQKGRCLGGNQPSALCKNCSTCFYCGKKGRWGKRPENSATCVMCEHTR